MGESGAVALAAALRENSSLAKLKCVLRRSLWGGKGALGSLASLFPSFLLLLLAVMVLYRHASSFSGTSRDG